ncbi:hypothetical protein A9Q99_07370 [Gammaproteobacteria bacterium 45_16_T64]|nr:hypothetical protein A9Q99_07370 [Gammaproteobacteria bacterium 45_16_T64]
MGCALPDLVLAQEISNSVKLELSVDIIHYLIMNDLLSAQDFRCLDCESKYSIQKLCMQKCARRM